MGLDVTVFLGRIARSPEPRVGSYFSVLAVVDLAHEGRAIAEDLAQREGDPPVFLYPPGGDGNRHASRDRYGDRLVAVPVAVLREAAKGVELQAGDPGHRLKVLRGLLRSIPRWVTHAVVFCH